MHVLRQAILLLLLSLEATAEPATNETICIADHLSCVDPSAPCEFANNDDQRHGAAVCSCGDTRTKDAKFCYKQRPKEPMQNETSGECKWKTGGQTNLRHGDTTLSKPTCQMSLTTLCPKVGPLSGGTNLFIWGEGLKDGEKTPAVTLTIFDCKVLYSNSSFIHCVTSNVWGTNVQGSYLRLKIDKGDGCQLEEKTSFTYYGDPKIIGKITPSKSILSGGMMVTVKGENLASVSRYLMQIRAVYKSNTTLSASLCQPVRRGENELICPTPRIDLTDLHLPKEEKRQRRNVPQLMENAQNMRQSIRNLRTKRQLMPPVEGLIKQSGLVIFAGFKVDGVTSLQTIQEWEVYEDPSFEKFEDEYFNYKPAWPDFDKNIPIVGKNILSGVYASDYEVKIGSVPCEALDISGNQIICTPPKDPPSPPPGGPERNGNPALTVRVGNMVFSPGYVHYELNVWNNSKVRYGIIGGLAVAIPVTIFIVVLIAVKCYLMRKKAKKDEMEVKKSIEMNKNDFLVGDYLHPRANLIQALPPELRVQVQSCILHTGRVDQTDIKSRGNRGAIYLGWLLDEKGHRMMSVDVKTFKDDNVPFRDLKAFLGEAVKLRGFDHPNVQRLIGLSILENLPKAITPVYEYGDLKGYLHRQRIKQEGGEVIAPDLPGRVYKEPEDITMDQMIKFAKDIANGMHYLCNLGFVHEDLAARNCVVDKDYVVKVSDATLSMDIYELDYWRPGEKLKFQPVKWMAPESLLTRITTSKSDVWSYGVTLWEIFTLGATPYPDVNNADMEAHLKAGHRLSKPDNMPVSLYAELTHCWAKEPNKRPHFKTLHDRLGNLDSLAGGDVNMGFEHDAETSSQQPDTDVTVDVEQTSNEDNTEVDDHPTETDAHLTEENASRISSEVYDDIGEEDVTVEVEPTKMSDDNMVF